MEGQEESVCYHHNDGDGRMAATIVKSVWKDTKFIEVNYKSIPNKEDYKGKQVFIVDFSFPKEIMEDIKKESLRLCWIDHHETAKKNMPELWNSMEIDGLREIGKCGALLTWLWFSPHEDIPKAVQLTNDYDLWLHKMEETKFFAERVNLFKLPFKPEEWQGLIETIDPKLRIGIPMVETYIEEGKILYEAKVQRCENAIRRGTEENIIVPIEGQKPFKTIIANVYPEDFSETGARILEKGYDISVTYCNVHGSTMVGLRSNIIDVSKIAESYQGGGHDHAAGFHVKDINQIISNKGE